MNKLKITWNSIEDKLSNAEFNKDRKELIRNFVSNHKIILPIENPLDSPFAILTFSSEEFANEYINQIQKLATLYNKKITDIEHLL